MGWEKTNINDSGIWMFNKSNVELVPQCLYFSLSVFSRWYNRSDFDTHNLYQSPHTNKYIVEGYILFI